MSERAWLVDLDGTLYQARWVKLAMAVELVLFGWGALRMLRRFRHEHEALRGAEAVAKDPFQEQLARTAASLRLPVEAVEAKVREWMIERPGKWLYRFRRRHLLAELREFQARGGRLALVSDYPAQHKLDCLQLGDLFEVVVASGEAESPKRLKPAPDGYLQAATLLGVAPEACLVIGDRDDADGEAARSAGMQFRKV